MQDSLFSYFQGYAWNFRSEMDIRPGQTYRITASHPDGRSSHTTVQLPEDFPTPILHTIPGGISNIENGTGYVAGIVRSEEHTSELQSRGHLVCRLLLEKTKKVKFETIIL